MPGLFTFSYFAGLLGARLEGFEPPTRGLGKRDGVLQRVAEDCQFGLSRRFFRRSLAAHCTVLRSRWFQGGVKRRHRRCVCSSDIAFFRDKLLSNTPCPHEYGTCL